MKAWLRRVALALLVALVPAAAFVAAPLPAGLLTSGDGYSVRLLDREGNLLRELPAGGADRRIALAEKELPERVVAAFLAAEDSGFHRHPGISPSAIARAAWQNLRAGHVVSGGSTLTQQLARQLVGRERTLWGKAKEALWALRLEAHLSKRQILAEYLNRVPLGNNTRGVEAAAQVYFGRSSKLLSWAQAAALASMPKGPTAYSPTRRPEAFARRQQWVLGRVGTLGLAPPDDVARARGESLDFSALDAAFGAPHFAHAVASRLPGLGLSSAVTVRTTLDARLQAAVEGLVKEELAHLGERRVGSAAVLVIDNATGDVLAYVGSADFFDAAQQGQNDGVQMKRQPGSALKPFVYAEAFKRGFTPATVIPDVAAQFGAPRGVYAPKNYDLRAHGPVRAREALANSYNVPAVRVTDAVGVERALEVLQRAGFGSLDGSAEHYGLGLALGNGEVSLWEAGRAYSGLSRGGVLWPLRTVLEARTADGSSLAVLPELKPRRFADSRAAALVTHVLSDNAARARAFGLENALRLPFPAAAKTGTSKGYSDNWTVGFTRERTVAVWAGNFDGTPMVKVSGITGAGPIFKRVMKAAMEGISGAPLVDRTGLEQATICPLSGARAGPHCPSAMGELFFAGSAPHHGCAMHRSVPDNLPAALAARCEALAEAGGRLVDLGPDYYEWARNEGLAQEPWLAAACLGATSGQAGLKILSPGAGEEFLVLSDLPVADQAIPLRVRAAPGDGALEVRLDGMRLFSLEPPFTGRLPVTRGEHVLTLHREGEETPVAQAKYRVREESRL